jgi:hypothetical protein
VNVQGKITPAGSPKFGHPTGLECQRVIVLNTGPNLHLDWPVECFQGNAGADNGVGHVDVDGGVKVVVDAAEDVVLANRKLQLQVT